MATTKTAVDQATRDAIHRALPGPKGDKWTTAKAVADAVGKGYSTVTEHLRAMVDAGTVAMDRQGRSNVFRKYGPSPKLKKSDVPVPRAELVKSARPRRRPTVTRGLETVELPAADVDLRFAEDTGGCDYVVPHKRQPEPVPDAPDGEQVWMATQRKGLNYHRVARAIPGVTVCGRSMRTGVTVPLAEVRETSAKCRECYPFTAADVRDLYAPVKDAEPVAVPQPPAAANVPAGGDLGAVVGFMEAARPVSAPPAEPAEPRRARRDKGPAKTYAVFGRGELQTAILAHVQALPAGTDTTPYQVATALNAYPGAVAYGLDRLRVKGNLAKTSDKPIRYAAV
jgi:DNA-binding transcriptional ArsR family regulator